VIDLNYPVFLTVVCWLSAENCRIPARKYSTPWRHHCAWNADTDERGFSHSDFFPFYYYIRLSLALERADTVQLIRYHEFNRI